MIIKNGLLYQTTCMKTGDLAIEGDRIVREGKADTANENELIIDAEGKYVIPGLVDVHFHGCDGYDFCDGTMEAIERIAAYELKSGITTIVPASMTLSAQKLQHIFENAAAFVKKYQEHGCEKPEYSWLAGIHMEGPYISEKKKGAQNPAYLQLPEAENFRKLNQASGNMIRIVSLAPELEGAIPFIREISKETVISIAHTTADYEIATQAFQAGASHVTHTYNAMPPFTHRAPGVIGAAFENQKTMMELICDGVHIHPAAIRATFSMFGNERMVLISDSMMGTGLEDGQYQLGGLAVTKTGSLAALADGTIAGSVTNLYDCMCNVIRFGIPIETAVRAASENAAKSAGLDECYGNLREGSYADVLIMNKDLKLDMIIHRGKVIKKN